MIEKYVHHEAEVSVDSELKGKHRQHCLCFQCDHFKPGQKITVRSPNNSITWM
jgi:hypothetical protein